MKIDGRDTEELLGFIVAVLIVLVGFMWGVYMDGLS